MDKLKWVSAIGTIIIVLNLGVLYWISFGLKTQIKDLRNIQQEVRNSGSKEIIPQEAPTVFLQDQSLCPKRCVDEINNLKQKVASITPGVIKEIDKTKSTTEEIPQVKELTIYFGSGKTLSDDWEDIPGMNAYIDTNNYKNIQSVLFEASLRIPTANGRVYARLYNKSDGRMVYSTEVSSEGPISTLVQSPNISLASGNKLYQIQMKTTMKYESLVDSARVKIVIK